MLSSLVDPCVGVGFPGDEFLILEPESNFLVGGFDSIGTVDNVSSDIDAEVTTDSAWLRVKWFSGTEHLTSGENSVVTLPDHSADWA